MDSGIEPLKKFSSNNLLIELNMLKLIIKLLQ